MCRSYLPFPIISCLVSDAPKNHKRSTPRKYIKIVGNCTYLIDFKVKRNLRWTIFDKNALGDSKLFGLSSQSQNSFRFSLFHGQVCLMKLPTLPNKVLCRHNFEFQHKISILIRFFTFQYFSLFFFSTKSLRLTGSGDCLSQGLSLSRLTASHKQSQFEQFFASVASTCSALGNGWSKTTDKNVGSM